MSCSALRHLVSAYVDGELVGEDRSALESHLAACGACRRLLDEERRVVGLLSLVRPVAAAPPALRARVEALAVRSGPARRARLVGLAAALLLASAAVFFSWGSPSRVLSAPVSGLGVVAADTHLRYARGQLPLEVESDRPEAVSGFFAGRVPFHLTLPEYPLGPGERKPYRLEGGRLVSYGKEYAAYVAYRMDDKPVSLLVTASSQAMPTGGDVVRSGSLTFHVEQVSGLQVITWDDKGLTYALASDTSVDGARSCLVCHGSRAERSRVQGFGAPRT